MCARTLCGRQADGFDDLRQQMQVWNATVAMPRVHGTTYRIVQEAWEEEKPFLQPLANRRAFPLVVEAVRRVSRDAFVCWGANRYSVPWQHAGQQVRVRELGEIVEIVREQTQLALHSRCPGRHQVQVIAAHHADIPLGSARSGKAKFRLSGRAPEVEVRSLSVYEALLNEEAA